LILTGPLFLNEPTWTSGRPCGDADGEGPDSPRKRPADRALTGHHGAPPPTATGCATRCRCLAAALAPPATTLPATPPLWARLAWAPAAWAPAAWAPAAWALPAWAPLAWPPQHPSTDPRPRTASPAPVPGSACSCCPPPPAGPAARARRKTCRRRGR